jgi:tetratricopeptide (TPR) repeat protein
MSAIRSVVRLLLSTAVALAGHGAAAAAQKFPPDSATNLKVLPKEIPIRALIDTMAGFTRALGVRCTYCHLGQEGEPLETYDFVKDEKVEKRKAREMLRMVLAINEQLLTKVPDRREPRVVVTCATCHHGLNVPRPLQQVLLIAYDSGGADSTEATYLSLRARYQGSGAYDFGEVPLADVASALRARGRLADALRFYRLNTVVSPNSTFALRQLAGGLVAAGDTAAAARAFARALAINPNDGQSKHGLDLLRRSP